MSNKIIEKLKDDSHYYGVVGKQYLSSSDITTLLYEPENFKQEKKFYRNTQKEKSNSIIN